MSPNEKSHKSRGPVFKLLSLLLISQLAMPNVSLGASSGADSSDARKSSSRNIPKTSNNKFMSSDRSNDASSYPYNEESPSPGGRIFTNSEAADTQRNYGTAMLSGSAISGAVTLLKKSRKALDSHTGFPAISRELRPDALTEHDIRRVVKLAKLKTNPANNAFLPKALGPAVVVEYDKSQILRMQAQQNVRNSQPGSLVAAAAEARTPSFSGSTDGGGGFMGTLRDTFFNSNNVDDMSPKFTTETIHLGQHGKRAFTHLDDELRKLLPFTQQELADLADPVKAAQIMKKPRDGVLVKSIIIKGRRGVLLTKAAQALSFGTLAVLLVGGSVHLIKYNDLLEYIESNRDQDLANQPYLSNIQEKPGMLDYLFSTADVKAAHIMEQESQGRSASRGQ